jgi:hypothetical protein
MFIFGVKISHNAILKYVTTMKAAWHVNFKRLMTKIVALTDKMVAEIS